jgi:excisionase family DNA binding protein
VSTSSPPARKFDLALLAGHAAIALRNHRKALRGRGWEEPAGLAEAEAFLAEMGTSAQERAGVSGLLQSVELDGQARDMLTVAEYAAAMGVHPSTVRRWIRSGELHVERRGRTVRIPREELYR